MSDYKCRICETETLCRFNVRKDVCLDPKCMYIYHLEEDNKSLEAAKKQLEESIDIAHRLNDVMREENESLKSDLDDWKTAHKHSVEQTFHDEKHCTCVPFLHIEIDNLKKDLLKLLKIANTLEKIPSLAEHMQALKLIQELTEKYAKNQKAGDRE